MDRHDIAAAACIVQRSAAAMHPLTLAYIGDAVYTLAVRVSLADGHDAKPGALHAYASAKVRAAAQASVAQAVMDELTEEERAVFLRGRNARPGTVPKHADMADYLAATGLEAVIGMLYLEGDTARLQHLLGLIFQQLNNIADKKRQKPFRA